MLKHAVNPSLEALFGIHASDGFSTLPASRQAVDVESTDSYLNRRSVPLMSAKIFVLCRASSIALMTAMPIMA